MVMIGSLNLKILWFGCEGVLGGPFFIARTSFVQLKMSFTAKSLKPMYLTVSFLLFEQQFMENFLRNVSNEK